MSTIQTFSVMFVPTQATHIERVTDNQKIVFNKLWIYPAQRIAKPGDSSGQAEGTLVPNSGKVYVGEMMDGAQATPDVLNPGDFPIKIELPEGKTKRLYDVLVQSSQAADGVFCKGWIA